MAPRKNIDPAEKTRIQIVCSKQQKQMLETASGVTGAEFSVWAMAHLLRDASRQDTKRAPAIIVGEVADKLRTAAAVQGVTVDRLIEQLLVVGGGG